MLYIDNNSLRNWAVVEVSRDRSSLQKEDRLFCMSEKKPAPLAICSTFQHVLAQTCLKQEARKNEMAV